MSKNNYLGGAGIASSKSFRFLPSQGHHYSGPSSTQHLECASELSTLFPGLYLLMLKQDLPILNFVFQNFLEGFESTLSFFCFLTNIFLFFSFQFSFQLLFLSIFFLLGLNGTPVWFCYTTTVDIFISCYMISAILGAGGGGWCTSETITLLFPSKQSLKGIFGKTDDEFLKTYLASFHNTLIITKCFVFVYQLY